MSVCSHQLRCAVLAQKNKELQREFDQCKEQLPQYQERLLMIGFIKQ